MHKQLFLGNGRILHVPYVDCPLASIICQTLRLERHLAYHLPLLKYLLLIGADVIAFGGMG